MARSTIDPELVRASGEFGVDLAHARHTARLSDRIYLALPYLHGLTKPSRRLLQAAALLQDVGVSSAAGKAGHHLRGRAIILRSRHLPLSPGRRRIVAEAVGLHASQSDLDAFLSDPGPARAAPLRAVAARIAAILRIADGLSGPGRTNVAITGIHDDGSSVEICVSPEAPIAAASAKADLWNRVMLRPVRALAAQIIPDRPEPWIRPDAPTLDACRRVAQRYLEQFLSREHALGDTEDMEVVHELRVAVRRLRTALRAFRAHVSGRFAAERGELGRLGGALGGARDADVFIAFLRAQADQAPPRRRGCLDSLMASERRRRGCRYREAREAVRSPAARAFREGLYHALRRPVGARGGLKPRGRDADRPIRVVGRRMLRGGLKRLTKYPRRLDRMDTETWHRLRIECKRVRYAGEFLADIYPDSLRGLTRTMTRMQDLLGQAHDADVFGLRLAALGRARRAAPGRRQAVVAIAERLEARRAECLTRGGRTWLSFTSAKRQKQIVSLIAAPLRG